MNFGKRSFQPILRYLYTKVTKLQGEISLHKHFNTGVSSSYATKSGFLLQYMHVYFSYKTELLKR